MDFSGFLKLVKAGQRNGGKGIMMKQKILFPWVLPRFTRHDHFVDDPHAGLLGEGLAKLPAGENSGAIAFGQGFQPCRGVDHISTSETRIFPIKLTKRQGAGVASGI